MKRHDERDTMFARAAYKEGEPNYEEYYLRNPDKKEIDDDIRSKPDLCTGGTATYDPILSKLPIANFKFLSDINSFCEGEPAAEKTPVDPEEITKLLKEEAIGMGAVLVGMAKAEPRHYYSYRGRQPERYGEEVTDLLPNAIVFAVEMKRENIEKAPLLPEVVETSDSYVRAAMIGMQISYFVRELGYRARNNMDANYLVVLPTLARDAGLGDIGKNGLLITPEYGQRIRLGAVTTDMPVVAGGRLGIDVSGFCDICGICAGECPSRAIPAGERRMVDGELRWRIKQEKCYSFWRKIGTDCGVCVKSCPFGMGIDITELENLTPAGLMAEYGRRRKPGKG